MANQMRPTIAEELLLWFWGCWLHLWILYTGLSAEIDVADRGLVAVGLSATMVASLVARQVHRSAPQSTIAQALRGVVYAMTHQCILLACLAMRPHPHADLSLYGMVGTGQLLLMVVVERVATRLLTTQPKDASKSHPNGRGRNDGTDWSFRNF